MVTFKLLALVLIATPGPSVMFAVGQALRLGQRSALVTVAANAAGFRVQVVGVALGAIFVILAMICDGAWAVGAAKARAWLAQNDRRLRQLNVLGGLVMMGLGLRFALSALQSLRS